MTGLGVQPEHLGLLSAMSTREATSISDDLRRAGADVLVVDGAEVLDKPTLMTRFADELDLAERPTSWDGLADALWAHLAQLSQVHAVIVWRNADVLMRRSMSSFLHMTTVFVDLARAIATTETGFPRPVYLHVVFVGDDPAFTSPD